MAVGMAATMCQSRTAELVHKNSEAEEYRAWRGFPKDCIISASFKHEPVRDIRLQLNGPMFGEDLTKKEWPCHNLEKVIHGDATHCNEESAMFLAGLLQTCAKNKDLDRGSKLHDYVLERGLIEECLDALVVMYAKCGDLAKAKKLIDTHKSRNVFTWTTLISAYARDGQAEYALSCFEHMLQDGLSPDAVTFTCALKACSSLRAVDEGAKIHEEIARQGLLSYNIVLATALIDMYAKCGALAKAQQVLEQLPVRDVVSWSALIAGYTQRGQGEQAWECFEGMQHEGISPNAVTFVCILKACGSMGHAGKGALIHDEIVKQGLLRNNLELGTALVDMYAKCGDLPKAWQVLKELPSRDVVSWTALISGYAQHGQGEQAIDCFAQMQRDGIFPDALTFNFVLKACASTGALEKGKRIHHELAKQGVISNNPVLETSLVDMYAKCGALAKARQVLIEELGSRNVAAWSALIAGYVEHGQQEEAFQCLEEMRCERLSPSPVTFAVVLDACGSIGAIHKGEQIHAQIAKGGLPGSDVVLGTALINMYVKCSSLTKAQQVLEELPLCDVTSWSALISGYAQQEQGKEALLCFERMQDAGFSPNSVTFACVLKACASIGAAEKGEQIHDEISRQRLLKDDHVLGTALVDMYVKCGALEKAQQVHDGLSTQNVVSWSALVAGYAQQGHGELALNCFEQMQHEGFSPDAVTFTSVLKACGIIGAAKKGEQIHNEIVRRGLLGNNVVLGTSLVDMYANCGTLTKAWKVHEELPSQDVTSWSALIAGYAQHGDGEQAIKCLQRMHYENLMPNSMTFPCMLNACSQSGMVDVGHLCFEVMSSKYGIKPSMEHYACMIDLLGRAGQLDKAVAVVQGIPSCESLAVWSILLGASQKWANVDIGRWAFEQAVQVQKRDGAGYVLLANIYSAGVQEYGNEVSTG